MNGEIKSEIDDQKRQSKNDLLTDKHTDRPLQRSTWHPGRQEIPRDL